jgi:hypothetical protein
MEQTRRTRDCRQCFVAVGWSRQIRRPLARLIALRRWDELLQPGTAIERWPTRCAMSAPALLRLTTATLVQPSALQ